ncbi:hypothetical protein V1477_020173 [Vespula maculifrons]|uniref:Uncharacterized protein n=1 Tax=Vespula maculifrons TaxID=7453 RepID=A0ABD2AL58_VESMC
MLDLSSEEKKIKIHDANKKMIGQIVLIILVTILIKNSKKSHRKTANERSVAIASHDNDGSVQIISRKSFCEKSV